MRREPQRLRDTPFDVLVIGGGINGAGIARDAALRGLAVALVDKGDFASGTSSRSSKLVHGGLRYLEHGHLGLVFEALRERATLLAIAPHLVRPLDFLIPVYDGARRGRVKLRLGLGLYDALARGRIVRRREWLGRTALLAREPALAEGDLRAGSVYGDALVDDARLVLANVVDAVEHGAVAVNYVEAVGLIRGDGRLRGARVRDRSSGAELDVVARVVVNASGPWGESVARLAGDETRRLTLSRGTHLVYPRLIGDAALLLEAGGDGRVFFAIPWQGFTLVGTTEETHRDDPDRVRPSAEEIAYLDREARRRLRLGDRRPLSAFAALRPLVRAAADAGSTSREHRIDLGPSGLLNLSGGKLTTYRLVAEEMTDRIERLLGRRPTACLTAARRLPGGDISERTRFEQDATSDGVAAGLAEAEALRLARAHGSRVTRLHLLAREQRDLLAPLCPHGGLALDAYHAARDEGATSVADVLLRRTHFGYGPCRGLDAAATTARALAAALGWDPARTVEETNRYAHEAPPQALQDPSRGGV